MCNMCYISMLTLDFLMKLGSVCSSKMVTTQKANACSLWALSCISFDNKSSGLGKLAMK